MNKYERRRNKGVSYPIVLAKAPYIKVQAIPKGINPETGKQTFIFKKISHPNVSFYHN